MNNTNEYNEIRDKGERLEALIKLSKKIREKERRRPIPFNDFLFYSAERPEYVYRDVFRLFYDMIYHYAKKREDRSKVINNIDVFNEYDLSDLFINDCDSPFFADRLFVNRLMRLTEGFRKGTFNNIFLFEGPPGSGKSTFLNNLLRKFEDYAKTDAGTSYKVFWRLDVDELGGFQNLKKNAPELVDEISRLALNEKTHTHAADEMQYPSKYLEFSCPNHDHPILLIPKSYRREFMNELITNEEFKDKLFNKQLYEWVLKDEPCHICTSIYKTLLDITGDPMKVFTMVNARKNFFSRKFGEGISVFNPGDMVSHKSIINRSLQHMINNLLKSDDVKFIYSYLAKTNNGILALMDIKEHNVERLKNYHGIISDGVHKVDLAEESIKTLFMGLVNPADKKHYANIPSFQDRIISVNIPFVLDYMIECEIYKNKFGKNISNNFLPDLLESFARIIISTRLDRDAPAIKRWINNITKYNKYLDRYQMLLKMDVYSGILPEWLDEEDVKTFNRKTKKDIFDSSAGEGNKGFSGRQSLNVFNRFYNKYARSGKPVTMEILSEYFSDAANTMGIEIPPGFIDALVSRYDYHVLQQVKEAIYYYNENQISNDIQNYLFAVNFEPGVKKISDYTGDSIEISEEYFKNIELIFRGAATSDAERKKFRNDVQNEYVSRTLYQDIRLEDRMLIDTEQFKKLFELYTKNLKINALTPYQNNESFRRAISDFNTENFQTYDERLKRDVNMLITNLKSKFKYNEEGARLISLYVLDKKLAEKFK